MVSKAEQKAEAIKRLRMLKVHPNVIKEFQYDNPLINCSYKGILCWIRDEGGRKLFQSLRQIIMLLYTTQYSRQQGSGIC